MENERLFPIAPDAVTMSATWSWPDGWIVTFWSHTRAEHGPETESARYAHLTAAELLDVVAAEVARRLLLT